MLQDIQSNERITIIAQLVASMYSEFKTLNIDKKQTAYVINVGITSFESMMRNGNCPKITRFGSEVGKIQFSLYDIAKFIVNNTS